MENIAAISAITAAAFFLGLTFAAWRRYIWVVEEPPGDLDVCPYSLTEVPGDSYYINVPHQKGVRWLSEIFSRSAKKFPQLTALQIPHTGESLTYSELDEHAERIAAALSPYLNGPDQVVAVAMSQDNWQIVAAHLGILKAGGTLMFLDTTLPEALIDHMLDDAQPAVILTRGQEKFRDLITLDVLALPEKLPPRKLPTWQDDPTQRLAAIFYTSGTTGKPRGVECPHAGYVNLALSYADYFDLVPGMDATSLTSSLGYDGSISEMYSAWVSGCAVVMLTKEQVRSGPDLVPILCEAEVTVLFCPPVLLTTLTQSPEIDLPYPLCRYIVPAGEAFPSALVEPWTRNRRQIINTYGPTEASTDTSRQNLRPGETITIGSPIPNVTYVILEIDQQEPLPHGEVGELCIGGVHVARGYRNLPEQTEKKFVDHPRFGRLYRTGDKCRIDEKTQRVHFLGRIDAQLKVRGHRVEAQAVEDILQTQFSEIEAAVLDYQNDALVAFVSAPSISQQKILMAALAPADWAAGVTASLAKQLPGPSVPTSIFLVEKFVMKSVSGKIDRSCLPDLSSLPENGDWNAAVIPVRFETQDKVEAEAEMDEAYAEVLAICRAAFEMPIGLDDGFAESGGHSIVIARLAQKLHAAGWAVSVKALLSDCNTARKVAARGRFQQPESQPSKDSVKSSSNRAARDETAAKVMPVGRFTILQTLFLIFLYLPAIATFIFVSEEAEYATHLKAASLADSILISLGLYGLVLATPFILLLWVLIVKFFIGGDSYKSNVTPGVYPKWSKMHLRVWCIERTQRLVLVPLSALYRSAPIRAFVLRQLGATVGKNFQCANDANLAGPLDLIFVEDNVTVQTAANVQTTSWSGQFLHVGPVLLGSGCKVGMRAVVSNDVSVGAGAWITPLTPALSDVGTNDVLEGAPAFVTGRCTELKRPREAFLSPHPAWFVETLCVLLQIILTFGLTVVPVTVILWAASTFFLSDGITISLAGSDLMAALGALWTLWLYMFSTSWLTFVVTSLLGCLFIRFTAARPGLYASRGLKTTLLLFRMNKLNSIQRLWTWTLTGQYLRALAGVKFSRVGASECDVMFNLVPELATADSQVFWSSGGYTNMLDLGAEHFKLRRLDMPRNFFTGNNCVVEGGQFPSNFLVGVSTPGNDIQFRRQMRSRLGEQITIAGNPPVRFADSSNGNEEYAHRPGFFLFLARVFLNDVFSIGTLPVTDGLIFTFLWLCLWHSNGNTIVSAIGAFFLTEICLLLLSIGVKKLVVGRNWGTDDRTPFWSLRHFGYFFAQDCFFAWCRGPLAFFAGTVVSNSILRWMGCTVGERTIITQPLQCFDWNAVNFGKDCYFDGFLQLHSFENMELKAKKTHIGDGCAINAGSTLMGGASIERDTTFLPLSLVLKEMKIVTGIYAGSPIEELRVSTDSVLVGESPPEVSNFNDKAAAASPIVDYTDWLKAAAIFFVLIDHTGYFLMRNDSWWAVFGRLAAPVFFFLLGYANTRSVPVAWILLGGILTLLESSNNDWSWVAPNILFSFALIRLGRPYALSLIHRYDWVGYALIFITLVAMVPFAGPIVDYGAEGWLWAFVGLSQRIYIDGRSAASQGSAAMDKPKPWTIALTRLPLCLVAAGIYIWQEQREFAFSDVQFNVLSLEAVLLGVCFYMFFRGPSRIQPPGSVASFLHFIGRRTLEIYVIELVAFELIVKLIPSLVP